MTAMEIRVDTPLFIYLPDLAQTEDGEDSLTVFGHLSFDRGSDIIALPGSCAHAASCVLRIFFRAPGAFLFGEGGDLLVQADNGPAWVIDVLVAAT